MVSVDTLCLMTFYDRNAAHTGIVQKSEPEQELHTLEFQPGTQICFAFQKCHLCHTARTQYNILSPRIQEGNDIEAFYEMIIYLKIRC